MRICIANTQELNPLIGGVERISSMLTNEWKEHGVYVILVSQYTSVYSEQYNPITDQYYLPNAEFANSEDNINYFSSIIKEHRIDIILNQASNIPSFTELCIDTKFKTSVKLVSAFHFAPNYQWDIMKNNFFVPYSLGKSVFLWSKALILYLYYKLYKAKVQLSIDSSYYKRVYRQSDAFVLLSKHFISDWEKLIDIKKEPKLFAINNALNISERIEEKREKRILYVGRIIIGVKRVDRLIDIWSDIADFYPEWSLELVGDGESKEGLQKMVNMRKIPRVIFTGFKNPYPLYNTSSILCMTSSAEGFGMVLGEAQQHGCVPIAYDSFESLKDIIKDGENGFRIPPFEKKSYIKKLQQLMDDESLREKMSKNAIESSKIFDIELIAQEWLNVFKTI